MFLPPQFHSLWQMQRCLHIKDDISSLSHHWVPESVFLFNCSGLHVGLCLGTWLCPRQRCKHIIQGGWHLIVISKNLELRMLKFIAGRSNSSVEELKIIHSLKINCRKGAFVGKLVNYILQGLVIQASSGQSHCHPSETSTNMLGVMFQV